MKIIKPFMRIFGFFPAIFYTGIMLIFLVNSSSFIIFLPAICVSICFFIAPIYLARDKQTWIGMLAVGIIALLLFIESSSPKAFSSQNSMSFGIVVILFYSLYYYIMKK